MNCFAEGEGDHWKEVRIHGGIPLCRKHRIVLIMGGTIKFKGKVNTKGWRWIKGTVE